MIRKIVEINEDLCNGCELCVSACHEGAIEMVDGKAKLVSDIYCDGLGDCLPACPTDAIQIIERVADEYSQDAVDARLESQQKALEQAKNEKNVLPVHDCGCGGAHDDMMKKMHSGGGCPGSAAMKLNVVSNGPVANKIQAQAKVANLNERMSEDPVKAELQSKLSTWPVQLNLVNPQADYLEGADLLIAADYTAFAYGNFHNEFIKGRVTLIGCPKLDDNDYYVEKIGMILKQNNIKSITVVRMEVPCCSGIVGAVKQAMLNSGKIVNYNEVTIGLDGSKKLMGIFSFLNRLIGNNNNGANAPVNKENNAVNSNAMNKKGDLNTMSMFCYQCQEAAGGKGCSKVGVCGKPADVANLQDLLLYLLKGVAYFNLKAREAGINKPETDKIMFDGLFATITNANFDREAFVKRINATIAARDAIKVELEAKGVDLGDLHDSAIWTGSEAEFDAKAAVVGILATENEDVRSLRELITYGLKGMAAYGQHAANLGKEDADLYKFAEEAMVATLNNNLTADDLVALTLKTGEFGVKAMAMLDEANTSTYGHPELTEVNIGVKGNPAILISGHDLHDMEALLEQTAGTGVDVYTHSEMLPANYYPKFKKYDHFVGNYGNAWWKQKEEFASFNGPILFTTNCIVPPTGDVAKRIFTTGSSGFPGCTHIEADENGKKDFSAIIEMAKTLPAPTEIENGTIIGGFAHNQVFALADKVVDAVKTGAVKQFFVMAGCDGRMESRDYYTEFAEKLPKDTIILTAGCAKYRYNKLNLGDIGGIPRVLDAGQCNDSYSLAVIALKLKEVFELNDINELPISYNIAWYEQKAVIVLLALLFLGVKNIHLGPTLPAFPSPNVANVLVETFGIGGITNVEDDIKMFLG